MNKKVVVGLSGGVDSSVAAYLLKKSGYEVIGVTMNVWEEDTVGMMNANPLKDAQLVAEKLEIPFVIFDFKKEFRECVVNNFTSEYLNGRTPNPCVRCNRYIKWEALLKKAKEFGADYIATGHYARIKELPNGRLSVVNSVTSEKDQTYALCSLTQEQLAHTLMPVGEYTKEEIRQIAADAGIPVAQKKDSQDICFIPDNDYGSFLERECPEKIPGPGKFVTIDGKVLGEHKGITHYTIGQRRGLGLPMGHRVVVTKIKPDTGEVVIGENEDVFTGKVVAADINYMGMESLNEPKRLWGKIRYAHKGEWCEAKLLPDGRVVCEFENPVRAATPGQTLVLYDGDAIALSGVID